ncbi:MAG TPA: cupin domain-containing protein [Caulobacteraceae bacterium]
MSEKSRAGDPAAAPFMVSGAEAPRDLNVLGERLTVLATAERTGGIELFRQRGEVGQGPPPHAHDWDETFYIISGELEFGVGDATGRLGPGSAAHIPGGVVHWFRFLTDGEMISVTSPGGASQLFTAIDAANPSGPPDMDAVVAAIVSNGGRLAA